MSALSFIKEPGSTKAVNLAPFVDHARTTVASSTGELKLDYGHGILTVHAARAQEVSGTLKLAGRTDLKDLSVSSDLELGHIIAVSLDDEPLAASSRILLQVMSEEQETNRTTEPLSPTVKRIVNLGADPWQVKALSGRVRFKRPDAARLNVTALDFNGYPVGSAGNPLVPSVKSVTLRASFRSRQAASCQVNNASVATTHHKRSLPRTAGSAALSWPCVHS